MVREVRLMREAELRQAFPGAALVPERFAGLVNRGLPYMVFRNLQCRSELNLHTPGTRRLALCTESVSKFLLCLVSFARMDLRLDEITAAPTGTNEALHPCALANKLKNKLA